MPSAQRLLASRSIGKAAHGADGVVADTGASAQATDAPSHAYVGARASVADGAELTEALSEVKFDALVDLCTDVLKEQAKDPSVVQTLNLYREYLRGVTPERREYTVHLASRYGVLACLSSGRPQLAQHAQLSLLQITLPICWQLCEPTMERQYSAVLAEYHDNGFCGNLLEVLDLLLLARPGVPVFVDWRRKGDEGHFQYGPKDFDLCTHLFVPTPRCRSWWSAGKTVRKEDAYVTKTRCNMVFKNTHRGLFWTMPPKDLSAMRHAYAEAAQALRPTLAMRARVDEICRSWPPPGSGVRVVGVHKRLATPEVLACQLSQRVPATAEYISKVHALFSEAAPGSRKVLYLATDDALAAEEFRKAFPQHGHIELFCRTGVKRSEGGVRSDGVDNEVHRSPGVTVADGEDILIDLLTLCKCTDLVCADSNVALCAALMNPDLECHALNHMMPPGWEEAASYPDMEVHGSYRVVRNGFGMVQAVPCASSPMVNYIQAGEEVRTTGRAWDGFVELETGGWMLVDNEQLVARKGLGKLLEPLGEPLVIAAPAPQVRRRIEVTRTMVDRRARGNEAAKERLPFLDDGTVPLRPVRTNEPESTPVEEAPAPSLAPPPTPLVAREAAEETGGDTAQPPPVTSAVEKVERPKRASRGFSAWAKSQASAASG